MRKSIIGGLGVGSGMAIFVAVSLPTGGVSAPSLLAWASALAGITALIMLSAFVALRARGIANVIERGDAQVWEGERSFGCLSLWSRGARASGQLPGQGTRRRTGARFPRRWRPVSIGGPGTEAAGLQGGKVMVTSQADRYGGDSQPSGGCDSGRPPRPGPQLAPQARGQETPVGGAPLTLSYPRFPALLREPLAGTTVHTLLGTSGHFPALFSQFKCMYQLGKLSAILTAFRLTSEGSLVRTQLRPPESPR